MSDTSAPSSSRRARAGVVVTGTEVLTGRIPDANGPWLAESLRAEGVDIGTVLVVGDRPDDLLAALGFLAASHDLVITSGGLGPTADDLTAAVVAEFQGREALLDHDLEQTIADIVHELASQRGWRLDRAATSAATRKQAQVPRGAHVLAPVGTAPGLVVPPAEGRDGPPVLVLPGPPSELQRMWPAALADHLVRSALGERAELRQSTLRLVGVPESELAAMLERHDAELDGLEITTCLTSGGELEIVSRYSPDAGSAHRALTAAVRHEFGDALFSDDGRSLDEIVASALRDAGATIATAESCTAGMLASRLADRPGSSAYLLGALVTYDNGAKRDLAGVPADLLASAGAVSAEVGRALADGARTRLHSTLGVGITGVAGPGGGTAQKPVGLVHVCVASADRVLSSELHLAGGRARIRTRSVVEALHLVRRLLAGEGGPA